MQNMLVAVFDSERQAQHASEALDALNEATTIGLTAGAIVTKSPGGAITVAQMHRQVPEAAMGATALGTLIGMLGGPVGLAIGAAAGLAVGATADVLHMKLDARFLADVERSLEPGKSAVVAQIYEEETAPVNERMGALGGVVFRNTLSDLAAETYDKDVAGLKQRLTGGRHG
jgi:uncharacterized membrane protein